MKHWKVIAYTWRQIKVHEKNYTTYDLELQVVVFALMIWRYYQYSFHIDVLTNDKILKKKFTQKDFESWPKKLAWVMKDYDMSVFYHSGKKNVMVEVLSRLSWVVLFMSRMVRKS